MPEKNGEYSKYAELLVNYCLQLQKGEKILIHSTTLAEKLVASVYQECLKIGALPEIQLDFKRKEEIFNQFAQEEIAKYVPILTDVAFKEFDAYLVIKAPFTNRIKAKPNEKIEKIKLEAFEIPWANYFRRTGNGELKRCLCQFPTTAAAKKAKMNLKEYKKFIFSACKLDTKNPLKEWNELGSKQQSLVDFLNTKEIFRFVNEQTDISFSTKNRQWINSDGKANMPSGEVYTAPVEDSVEGEIHFDYPLYYKGNEMQGITLIASNGIIEKWTVKKGQKYFDQIMKIHGANVFGEAAIGTNYAIQKFTNNVLFDEKIGGTIHMAIGQSYAQAGGKNKSPIHLDMIAGMKRKGIIYADNEIIYKNGKFLGFFL
jgi:aminopeptidase